MHSDLRRLLWHLRAGVVRSAALEEAVDKACAALVARRFEDSTAHLDHSRFARDSLGKFEQEIARARLAAPEGRYRLAVRAVGTAEAALGAARKVAEAERSWENLRMSWTGLLERFDLAPYSPLASLQEMSRTFSLTESFLLAGESGKARFVNRMCRERVRRLTATTDDPGARRELARRLVERQHGPFAVPAGLVRVLSRMVDEGLVELACRLLDDWELGASPTGKTEGKPTLAVDLGRISEITREASLLARELASAVLPGTTATEEAVRSGN